MNVSSPNPDSGQSRANIRGDVGNAIQVGTSSRKGPSNFVHKDRASQTSTLTLVYQLVRIAKSDEPTTSDGTLRPRDRHVVRDDDHSHWSILRERGEAFFGESEVEDIAGVVPSLSIGFINMSGREVVGHT
jgi:hypothetical protein